MHYRNLAFHTSVILLTFLILAGNLIYANKARVGVKRPPSPSKPGVKAGVKGGPPKATTSTRKPLFGPKTTRKPQWLKDSQSRAGKINMRPLEGTPHTILRKRMKWIEGDIACQIQLGTQMALLDTQEKADKLVQVLMNISLWNNTKPDFMHAVEKYEYGLNRRYWIGLSDLPAEEGVYEWKSNDDSVTDRIFLTYTFFHPGQPDHLVTDVTRDKNKKMMLKIRRPIEHCVALWNPTFYRSELHSFNDEPCNKRYYVICDNPPSGPPKIPPSSSR